MTHPRESSAPTHDHRPPAGLGWMLPVYDSMSAAIGIPTVHRRLLAQAGIAAGHRVLDVGCGTGTLTVAAKQAHPEATVVGIDPDGAALDRARAAAWSRNVDVQFDLGFGGDLPYATGSVDRVISAFVVHHLLGEERQRTFTEMLRVLAPDGSVHVVDFGRGTQIAADLEAVGFGSGSLTRGRVRSVVPVTIVDATA